MSHGGVLNLVWWHNEAFEVTQEDRATQLAGISFDACGWEMWPYLSAGASIHLAGEEVRLSPEELKRWVIEEGITISFMPTPVAEQAVRMEWGEQTRLRLLLTGGDELHCAPRASQGFVVVNNYGPTENSVVATSGRVEAGGSGGRKPSIGRPITNNKVYVVDENMGAVSAGVAGEICIGGASLGRGYFGSAELTAEKFRPNGMRGAVGERVYRTGDLGRWREGGELEFISRLDNQVKVRGYRIELGEIEAEVMKGGVVKQCAVVVREDGAGEKRIVAYVVGRGEGRVESGEVRKYLQGRLPDYMVPSRIVELSEMPLTVNGKVDRKALPAPTTGGESIESQQPGTAVEEIIADIFAEVLKVERIGVEENFFEQGGHSLLATQVVSRVREALQVELPLRALFEAPTVEGLARAVERERGEGGRLDAPAIEAVSRERELELSYAQQRLWFMQQLEPESAAYNIPMGVRLRGEMNETALRQSLEEIARRHEVLRTRFETREGRPVQVIDEASEIAMPVSDVSHLETDDAEQRAGEIAQEEAVRSFDLERGPVWRARLVRLSNDEHLLVINQHHVASDGWSLGVMVNEFTALYESYREGKQSRLAELEVQYADFAVWQREWLTGEVLQQQMDYWKHQLAQLPLLELPTDHPRPAHRSHHGAEVSFMLSAELTHQLKALSRREGVTLFMTLLAAFQSLLSRYSAQHDVAIGTAIAGRNHSGIETLIGFFVNTLVLRTDLSANPTVEQLLADVRQTTLDAYEHQDVPFEKLVEQLQPERSLSREPMFQVMLIHQQGARAATAGSGGGLTNLRMRSEAVSTRTAKFDLTLSVGEQEGVLEGALEYATELYEKPRMSRLIGHLRRMLEGMVGDGRRRVKELPLLSEAELQQVVFEWNDAPVGETADCCVQAMFERQAERAAEAVAVVCEEQRLSYGELNSRANQLAHHLRTQGVGPEVRVGICLDRGVEMVVALMGVLKAGGAYVPLDPAYPEQRLDYMMEDAGVEAVITEEGLQEAVRGYGGKVVMIDRDWELICEQSIDNPASVTVGENLAYLIYTSGSTGRPKGVMICQKNAVAFINWEREVYAGSLMEGVLASTSICFDLSVFELFGVLCVGGRVVMAQSAVEVGDLVERGEVVLINTVPSACDALVRAGGIGGSVRVVNLAGEALRRELVERVYESGVVERVYNLYGPSETTTYSTYSRVERGERTEPSIGRATSSSEVYVLDEWMEAVGIGVVGEVCIGGEGLSRGYYGRGGLTAEKYVPTGIGGGGEAGRRVYRTGDKGRYGEGGEIEYLGRADQQVKVRGYRIELGEIEAEVMKGGVVKQCAVVVREDEAGEKRIVAYVVGRGEGRVESGEVRKYLQGRLPDYMVPSRIVELSEMPLTVNGKVDRKALPAAVAVEMTEEGEEERTAIEEIIAGIFAEVLRREKVGVEENFFELGGHSLLATQVVSRVREALQVELPLRALFEAPTVAGLSKAVERERGEGGRLDAPAIEAVSRERELELSYAQQRLWFMQQLEPESAAYNIPMGVRLRGEMNETALRQSLEEIARRHEVLRTRFETREGRPVQVIDEASEIAIPVSDVSHLETDDAEQRAREIAQEEAVRSFDLERGPVWRARLVRLSNDEHLLVINQHHVASDGWSLGVMVSEFTSLYESYGEGKQSRLAELEVQYADFAVWQRKWLTGEVLQQQMDYWKHQLAQLPLLELPTDHPRPAHRSHHGAEVGFMLSAELTHQLKALSRREGVTLFMTLLAAFQTTLGKYASQRDVAVGTPIANRNRLQTEPLIGFFVNQLVLRTDLSANPSFRQLLRQVRQTTLEAYSNQDVPFEKLVEQLQPERDFKRGPLFEVEVVLQNTPREELRAAGVEMRVEESETTVAKFDLTLRASESKGGLEGAVVYATELYEETSMRRMAGQLRLVLEAMVRDAEEAVGEVSLLSEAERQQVVVEWNDTHGPRGGEQSVHEAFDRQAERVPEAIAIVYEEQQLSYGELSRRSNQLARYLRRLGVGPEVCVALYLNRSPEMVIALFGVLKAGGAYVPLDIASPRERLAWMLSDVSALILMTKQHWLASLPQLSVKTVCLDQDWETISGHSTEMVTSEVMPANLAYLLYTSGSTGQPKAVMIEHSSLYNYLRWCSEGLLKDSSTSLPMTTALSFDAALKQLFPPLLRGEKLRLIAEETVTQPDRLAVALSVDGEATFNCVPSLWQVFLEAASAGRVKLPAGLRRLFVGGERLSQKLVSRTMSMLPGVEIWNFYGPTEVTANASVSRISDQKTVSIGRPIANTHLYVLDDHMILAGVGTREELYIGGAGLARGYFRRAEQTADRFVPDGVSGAVGARLYRSGDEVKWRRDGEMEFVGRGDEQVKVRGYRIELGEIEAALMKQGAVVQCVVTAREDEESNQGLAAYYVTGGEGKVKSGELRRYLRERLPDYMVPSWIVELSEMPLTVNGKVDRKALPVPVAVEMTEEGEEERTAIEEIVAGIFAEVLRREKVGVEENFFELGGHSLLATQVVSRVREALQVELPLRALFEAPTVEGLARAVERERGEGGRLDAPAIEAVSRERELELSYAQQRLWFIQQLEPESAAYNIPLSVRLRGEMNQSALRQSLEEIARRHEVLRTRFKLRNGHPVQVIDEASEIAMPVSDISHLKASDAEQRAGEIAQEEAVRSFDLERGPVWRARLVRLSNDEHLLVINQHHVASDGWSLGVMVNEFTSLYESYGEGKQSRLAELEVQYADFAVWQREWLQGPVLEEQIEYWKRQLAEVAVLELPTDHTRPAYRSHRSGELGLALSQELTRDLKALSRREGVTLFMTMLAALQTLMSRYSGQQDVAIGTAIAGRNHAEIEGLIGFFVNTLVLRTDLSSNPSVGELLASVRQTTLDAYEHQDVPFERLVEQMQPERSLSREPMFQVMLIHQNAAIDRGGLSNLRMKSEAVSNETAKFDLTLAIREEEGGLICAIEYAAELYEGVRMHRMKEHLRRLLEGMVGDRQRRAKELPLLSEAERHQLEMEWNKASLEREGGESIQKLFEQQAEEASEAIAVVYEEQRVSYGELNRRANQLAHHLRTRGVGPEVRVGVCVRRGVKMVIALLGVLKAGGAYVPLDPAYPEQRLDYMMEDAGVEPVITEEGLQEAVRGYGGKVVMIDRDWELICEQSVDNPAPVTEGDNLAYLIYTSGSTGKPKGVSVVHKGVVRLVNHTNYVELSESEVILQLAPISFDASTFEIWGSLLNGGQLVLMPSYTPTLEEIAAAVREYSITTLWLTSALFHQMVDLHLDSLSGVRQLLAGGDVLDARHVEKVIEQLGERKLINGYGPTENTTFTCCYCMKADSRISQSVPIGEPIANTQVRILDRNPHTVPVGVFDDIYTGGDGLARGYLNRADLTAEKFLPDPFGQPGSRLYSTGDIGRYRADGNIEFLGRRDEQVKVRGYRIELGEIEAALMRQEGVEKSVVVVRKEEGEVEKRIVAYVVGRGEGKIESRELREYLRERLPEYMIPSAFVFIENLPLTVNGKVDRKALPVPIAVEMTEEGEEERTAIEEIIAGIFEEVLRREKVGVEENFFELGGHSLLATQVVSRVREALQVELPLRALFEAPTVEGLAKAVEGERDEGRRLDAPAIEAVSRDGELELSYAQQRLWFIQELEPESAAYNIPMGVRLRGEMNETALRQSLEEIGRRHEVLRTRFETREGRPVQVIDEASEIAMPVSDVSHLETDDAEQRAGEIAQEEAVRSFDLERGPVWRARLVRLSNDEHLLVINQHHVASDGWSLGVMVSEFTALYESYCEGKQSRLSELEVQYADFAVWQREWLTGEVLQQQMDYWKHQLAQLPLLELPTDHPRPAHRSHHGAEVSFMLSAELTHQLKALSRREGVTLFMTLLAAFQSLLSRYSAQHDVAIGTAIAGRNHSGIESLIGFFVNTLVLRTDLSANPTVERLLADVRQTTLEAYSNQEVPFEKVVEQMQPERSLSREPMFQVMLIHQQGARAAAAGSGGGLTNLRMRSEAVSTRTAKFDLTLSVGEQEGVLEGALEYATELYERPRMSRLIGHLRRMLEGMIVDGRRRFKELPLLSEAELQQVVFEWNDAPVGETADCCVQAMFERQAERAAEAVAVVCEEQRLSYGELNSRANQLAHHLRTLGVGPEVRVGICLDRGVEMVVALMGVLKAGGAYVPLDPSYPEQRLDYMMGDAEASVLITQQHLLNRMSGYGGRVVMIDRDWGLISQQSSSNPASVTVGENLAYLIYTSGSTGRPKGVMICQKNAVAFINWEKELYAGSLMEGVLASTSICFDLSVFELFGVLCVGGRVVMAQSAVEVGDLVERGEVVLINTVPSACDALVRAGGIGGSVRVVNLAGEALRRELVERVYESGVVERVYNLYGPSETTTYSTYSRVERGERTEPSIGRATSSSEVYVLDEWMEAVGIGVVGEVCIGGEGLSRGYYGRGGLTAEKYVPTGIGGGGEAGRRVYRTGDKGRYGEGGEIEYLGRADQQVKVRGYRIELGEIEAEVMKGGVVKQCAVVVREDEAGEKRIVAYVVGRGEGRVESGEVRKYLQGRLPDYMVPSRIVELSEMPLTVNGKVDRKALPAAVAVEMTEEGEEERTAIEEIIAGIFEEVLRVERVGIRDNFFELGGHSLLATQVVSRVREALQVELPLRALFEAPTVAGLSKAVERERSEGGRLDAPAIEAVSRDGELELSYAQQRLWFMQQLEPESAAYNIPMGVRLRGEMNETALRQSLEEIARRHEVLRTRFETREGRPVQVIDEASEIAMPVSDISHLKASDAEQRTREIARQEAQRSFDLERGPVWRARLVRLSNDEHLLVINQHHVASDGWSLGVMVNEFTSLYESYREGKQSRLAELEVQYADFAVWQRNWLTGEVLQQQMDYWKHQLAQLPLLELPTDRARSMGNNRQALRQGFTLPDDLVQKLSALSRREGVTLFMTMLAGFELLLARYTGQTDVAVGTPIAGRNRAETEGLIGFFVNSLVLRTDLSGNPTLPELLHRIRRTALEAYAHQDLPFEKLVEELQPDRNLSRHPFFEILFNYVNISSSTAELPNLTLDRLATT